MTRDLEAMLEPDAFMRAIQGAWDGFRTRSNMRVYGVPDPQAWCDQLMATTMRGRGVRQAVESVLVAAIHATRRADDNATRQLINRAKYLLLNY